MPKFLIRASYTAAGAKGVQSAGGTSRRDAVATLAEGLGGRLESFYFAFGATDVYAVIELPDNQSAAAASIAVNTAGADTRGDRRGRQALGRLSAAGLLIDPHSGVCPP